MMLATTALLLLAGGCAATCPSSQRPFIFGEDTFAFENGLVWEYHHGEDGRTTTQKREPAPDYSLHCFPLSRAAKEFFLSARFDPSGVKPEKGERRALIKKVVATNPRRGLPEAKKIVIPGYADLHDFSVENEDLLKQECGSATSSYFQRGHWRMIFPFTGRQRAKQAEGLAESVSRNCPAIAHVYTFPRLSINHAILVYGAESAENGTAFTFYDPNDPCRPGKLLFDANTRRFFLEPNAYFRGGHVQVYQVFHKWNY
jgi:hypothetical protein